MTPTQIFHDIPEMIDLKWKERVTVFSPDQVTEFEKLALKLVDMDSGQRISDLARLGSEGRGNE